MRLRGLLAFIIFLVAEELVRRGAGWLVFQKLQLIEASWAPVPFLVIEGIGVVAVIVASFAAGAAQRKRLRDYGFATEGAMRHLLAGSAWGLGAVALTVGAIAVF